MIGTSGCKAKRKRARMGDLKIVVAGCVAAQEGAALLRRIPEVDLVMGEKLRVPISILSVKPRGVLNYRSLVCKQFAPYK